MTSKTNNWNKQELKIYILLLCANADSHESKEEIDLIKSKTNSETFEKIFKEFSKDSEDESLAKIDENIQLHYISRTELIDLQNEISEVFFSDNVITMMEKNLARILDNIIY